MIQREHFSKESILTPRHSQMLSKTFICITDCEVIKLISFLICNYIFNL